MDTLRTIARRLLGAFLIFTGTGHLSFARTEFQAQVPSWIPVAADLVVLVSGVVELALGLALLAAARHRLSGSAASLAACVFLFVWAVQFRPESLLI